MTFIGKFMELEVIVTCKMVNFLRLVEFKLGCMLDYPGRKLNLKTFLLCIMFL